MITILNRCIMQPYKSKEKRRCRIERLSSATPTRRIWWIMPSLQPHNLPSNYSPWSATQTTSHKVNSRPSMPAIAKLPLKVVYHSSSSLWDSAITRDTTTWSSSISPRIVYNLPKVTQMLLIVAIWLQTSAHLFRLKVRNLLFLHRTRCRHNRSNKNLSKDET